VSLVGGHTWEDAEDDRQTAGGGERYLPRTKRFDGRVGGTITLPLVRALGARATVIGDIGETRRDAAAGLPGSNFDRDGVDAAATLFLRDPGFGHFDLGYRFGWEEPSGISLERETSHGIVVAAGLYVPDQGMGFVDWDVAVSYTRAEQKLTSGTQAVDEYGVVAEIAYYAGRSIRLSGGASWQVANPDDADDREDLRGIGRISWLMPFELANRRFASLDLSGSYGRIRTDLGGSFSDAEQYVWSAGIGLAFDYPGANSIMELIRERR